MRVVVLTITKKYFDLILSGEKKTEYRKAIPYYEKKLSGAVSGLILHYRQGVFMYCDVKRVDFIDRPPELEKSVFITTPKCYAIRLTSARLMV